MPEYKLIQKKKKSGALELEHDDTVKSSLIVRVVCFLIQNANSSHIIY
jgi:hypothetical protein